MTLPHPERTERHRLPVIGADPSISVLPDRWYAIASSRAIARKPVSLRRLGRALVLWRDEGGALHAHDARCPHRGVDLGLGRVVGGEIECPYHGLRFAADGACTRVPCDREGAPIRKDLRVRRYPVREHRGLVWLWSGEERAELPPIPWFDDLPAGDDRAFDHEEIWPIVQLRVMEGMLDLHHAPFAHRPYLPGIGSLLDPYEAAIDGDTVRTWGKLVHHGARPGRGFAAGMDARLPGLLSVRFGERMRGFVAATPIDGESTWVFARYFVDVPVLGKLLAALSLWLEFAVIQPGDRRMLSSTIPLPGATGAPDVHDYKLVRADVGVAMWHKLYSEASRPPMTADLQALPTPGRCSPLRGSAPSAPPLPLAALAPGGAPTRDEHRA